MESTDMCYLPYYYGDCLEIGREYRIYSEAGGGQSIVKAYIDMPAKMRGYVVYWKDMGCSYCKLFSGFGPTAPIGEKRKKRSEAGDGPGGCRETV